VSSKSRKKNKEQSAVFKSFDTEESSEPEIIVHGNMKIHKDQVKIIPPPQMEMFQSLDYDDKSDSDVDF